MQTTQDWTVVNDPAMNEPYAYYFPMNNIWCSYDHAASVATKVRLNFCLCIYSLVFI